eukprot:SAG11_NODE_560_length_8528_cov_4.697710_9_plen_70_part_00
MTYGFDNNMKCHYGRHALGDLFPMRVLSSALLVIATPYMYELAKFSILVKCPWTKCPVRCTLTAALITQ